jgi:hypothetical protein
MKLRVINLRAGEIVELRHQGAPAVQVILDRERQDFTLYYRTPHKTLCYDNGPRSEVMIGNETTSKNA